jgi:hypothetical protein
VPSGRGDLIDRASFELILDEVSGHLNAQHGRLIDLTVWLLAHPAEWQGDGLWTPNQYLAWRCGIGPTLASNVIAVAERAADLPAAIAAVRRGEMSLDQLMPIVRSVPAWADARGRPIRASGASPAPPGGPPRPIDGRYEHPLGERLNRRWVTFVDPGIPPHLRRRQPDIA